MTPPISGDLTAEEERQALEDAKKIKMFLGMWVSDNPKLIEVYQKFMTLFTS